MKQLTKDILANLAEIEAYTTVSKEAIAFQHESKLLKGITELVVGFRASSISQRDFVREVNKIIWDETGIYSDFTIVESIYPDAWCRIPSLGPNHPFFIELSKEYRSDLGVYNYLSKSTYELIKRKFKNIGYVDLVKGRVGGAFSELQQSIAITTDLLFNKEYTEAGVASVINHEVGHIFTTFEVANNFFIDNYALMALTQSLINEKNVTTRTQILKNAGTLVNLSSSEVGEVSEVTDPKLLATIFSDARVREARAINKAKLHNSTGSEMLADQFSTRHGGGRELVLTLDAMEKAHGNNYERMSSGRKIWDSFTVFVGFFASIGLTIFGLLSGAFVVFALGAFCIYANVLAVTINPFEGNDYDKPGDRFKRIRNDLVNALKDKSTPDKIKKTLIEDIKAIDNITADMKPHFDTWEQIGIKIFSSHRRALDIRTMEQQLEKIASNDLFLKAAEFSTV